MRMRFIQHASKQSKQFLYHRFHAIQSRDSPRGGQMRDSWARYHNSWLARFCKTCPTALYSTITLIISKLKNSQLEKTLANSISSLKLSHYKWECPLYNMYLYIPKYSSITDFTRYNRATAYEEDKCETAELQTQDSLISILGNLFTLISLACYTIYSYANVSILSTLLNTFFYHLRTHLLSL